MQPNNNLIIAPSSSHTTSGKSLALQALLKILRESKNGSWIITDPKGYIPQGTLQRGGFSVHTIVQSKEQLLNMASNNWLKTHGYPIRRKMRNAERRRNRKQTRHKKTYPVVVSVLREGIPCQVNCKP